MDWRNRIGLYGSYFLGMAGIGFTLPYLSLYLGEEGMSDRTIGLVSTLAALAGLAQYPISLWSDRIGRRTPFLVVLLAVLALSTFLLDAAHGFIWLRFLVLLFAENGLCRATVESLAGAEAAHLAEPGRVGAALGALRFWKPVSIVAVALAGGFIAEQFGVEAILGPLAVVQALAVAGALMIHERNPSPAKPSPPAPLTESVEQPAAVFGEPHATGKLPVAPASGGEGLGVRGGASPDGSLWVFAAAMVLFHLANSPGGVYLGLFLKRDLEAPPRILSYAFVVSMLAWMAVVWLAGGLADQIGRRPLLIAGWMAMAVRLLLVSLSNEPWQVFAVQVLDGTAQALFAVVAAAWVTDRLADPGRVGEAQALVLGSALGPTLSGLVVDSLGYRGMFALLGVGVVATALVILFVPETLPGLSRAPRRLSPLTSGAPRG
jgi:MFS family permease